MGDEESLNGRIVLLQWRNVNRALNLETESIMQEPVAAVVSAQKTSNDHVVFSAARNVAGCMSAVITLSASSHAW